MAIPVKKNSIGGEGASRAEGKAVKARPARALLPGVLGALIETQLRTQLRTPSARMALLMPTLMMGLFALSLARPEKPPGGAFAMVVFLSLVGGNAFVLIGRGIALILSTQVSRAAILVASDVSNVFVRLPPLLSIIAVSAWRNGIETAAAMTALALALLPVSLGTQHFVTILTPFALPRDRLNPFARRGDSRQGSAGFLSLLAALGALALASPFLFLIWLSTQLDATFRPWLLVLAGLGALATYAVLIAAAESLFFKRERRMLEVLLDDSPG